MSRQDHRIYGYMSEPIRWGGLTVDELLLLGLSLTLLLILESLFLKLCFGVFGTLGVYMIKRLKKLAVGFSLISYLHWTLGLRFCLPLLSPPSWKRFWLP